MIVRLLSVPWMALCLLFLAGNAAIQTTTGIALVVAVIAGALFLADYLLSLRTAGGAVWPLVLFVSAPLAGLALLVL